MRTMTKVVGLITAGAIALYAGMRYERHIASTRPYVIVEDKIGITYFVDVQKEKAFLAVDVKPTYDKLSFVKKLYQSASHGMFGNISSLEESLEQK